MSQNSFYYNKLWQEKRFEPNRLYMQERVLKTIRTLFSEILNSDFTGSILDVGAGDGSFVAVCLQKGMKASGVDICDGIDFEKDKLPFSSEEFDCAVMYSVIEHLHNPSNILLELSRVLKSKGRLVIITPHFDLQRPWLCSRDFYNDPTHVRPYNRISIRTLMKMYGFKERFVGLWTVCKSPLIWKLPEIWQFYLGALLPFTGRTRYVPQFLKGKSKGMLCVFEKTNEKG